MELIIGRKGNCPRNIPPQHTKASREHARLRCLPEGDYEIEGIDGRTFSVNGKTFNKKVVKIDTLVTFGDFTTTVKWLLKEETVKQPYSGEKEDVKPNSPVKELSNPLPPPIPNKERPSLPTNKEEGATTYSYIIGREGNTPLRVPAVHTTVSRKHAMLKLVAMDQYEIEGIGQRVFMVNGETKQSAVVGLDTPLQFGIDFKTTVRQLLKIVPSPPPPPPPPPSPAGYEHLEKIWRDYNDTKQRLSISVSRLNNARMVVLPLGSGLSIAASLLGAGDNTWKFIGSIIGVIFSVLVSIIIGQLSVKRQRRVQTETEELTAKFMLEYVCPNPKCKHFLGYTPPAVLKAKNVCPYCKAKLSES